MKKTRPPLTEAQQTLTFSRRALVLGGAQVGLGGILAARMGWISIAENERYSLLAESNRVNLTLVPPRRGWIVDRVGKPLAMNRTAFRVDIIPDRLTDKVHVLGELQKLIGLTAEEVADIDAQIEKSAGFQPVPVVENLDWEKFAAVSIRASDLPGVAPAQSYTRHYPIGGAVAHLLGYVGAASAKDYEKSKDPLLVTPGFKVGKDGIERTMEDRLRGKPGARRTEVTARGKLVRELATRPDVAGQPVRLTIDSGLQDYASRRMGDNSGSCVIMDCLTGDILAMTSMPAYDPNSFSDGIGQQEWQMLREDDHIPLTNKTLQGLYPPGSTAKPMTTLALLSAGIDPEATVFCSGAYKVGGTTFHCASRRGHGSISMHRALVQSCDIYYYHFGRIIGAEPIAAMARKLGLGAKYNLPYNSQSFGTVPDPVWFKKKYKKNWSVADTVNMSIGQGYVLANPLQLALMAARIASGRDISPRLLFDHPHGVPGMLDINPEHLAFVREAMGGVVNSNIGTAAKARLPLADVQMGGKTGTAQVRRITMAERRRGVRSNASLAWRLRDHALFVAFAPVDAPRYAAAVVVEHGGWGAGSAAPVARDALTYLFDQPKAMEILEGLERGWGGDVKTRMQRKMDTWMATHDPERIAEDKARAEAEAAAKAAEDAEAANASAVGNNSADVKDDKKAKATKALQDAKDKASKAVRDTKIEVPKSISDPLAAELNSTAPEPID